MESLSDILKLPKRVKTSVLCEPDYYGFSYYLRKELGIEIPRISTSSWVHGWRFEELIVPEQILYSQYIKSRLFHVVATNEQELFLNKYGLTNVRAAGYPYLYSQDLFYHDRIDRIENSLLVMPAHTLNHLSIRDTESEDFVKFVDSKRSDYNRVVFCIHQDCLNSGLWLEMLRKYEFEYVMGSKNDDLNSLRRMYILFNSFDTLLTNTWGSHVLYSAYSGMNLNFYTPFYELKEKYFSSSFFGRDNVFYKAQKINLSYHNYEYISRKYDFIFKKDKVTIRNWANKEMGLDSKLELAELPIILNWGIEGQLKGYCDYFSRGSRKILGFK